MDNDSDSDREDHVVYDPDTFKHDDKLITIVWKLEKYCNDWGLPIFNDKNAITIFRELCS